MISIRVRIGRMCISLEVGRSRKVKQINKGKIKVKITEEKLYN